MRVSIILVLSMMLVGCGAIGPARQILSKPPESVDCHYVREQTKWKLDCKAAGTINIDDTLPFPMPPGL